VIVPIFFVIARKSLEKALTSVNVSIIKNNILYMGCSSKYAETDVPKAFRIKEIRKDSPLIQTYIFDEGYDSKPGQFVMVWVPGVDEKPISVAYQNENEMHLTVAAIGPFTKKMEDLKIGDRVGIRGPFGSEFSLDKGKKYCLVGGGVGVPPLFNTAYALRQQGVEVEFIIGGRSKEYIIFETELKKIGVNVHVCTDDGSQGYHGFTPSKLSDMIQEGKQFDCIQTCGPEIMMVKVAEIAKEHSVYSEVSIERYMKCGFGICGQCSVDGEGKRMCVEGPVVPGNTALSWEEFGAYHRGPTGEKY